MADTALSLANTLVDGVLGKIAGGAGDEFAKMLGVRQEVRDIKGELEMIQSFLRDADTQQGDKEILRTWIRQVKDLAYQIEDCLELFSLHLENRSLWYRLRTLHIRHRIASDIRNISAMVQKVRQRYERYNPINPLDLSHEATSKYGNLATRSLNALFVEETQLVGLSEPKKKLIECINDGNACRKVIWITGMGGLGKTTLARKVYDNNEVRGFTTRAWVTVSQKFDTRDLLMKIWRDISGDRNEKMVTLEELIRCVRNKLKNNAYLVVLDDLWTLQAWHYIENAFPDNNMGSRIIVTTRNKNVAEACNSNREIFPVDPLSDEDSRSLLLRKLNKSNEFFYQQTNLNEVIIKIIKKCKGLPLAIITIGALLATKPENEEEWWKLIDRIGSKLETGPNVEDVKQILDLSYIDLPYHLKPCLLYLSIFPEDYELERKMVVYRWMAEGFVRERRGMAPEEVAKEYFNELVSRSLIQPSCIWDDDDQRWIKRYRVHDIMRELIVERSIEENLIFITSEQKNVTSTGNFRHLVVTDSTKFRGNESSIRSVSIFNVPVPDLLSSSPSKSNLLRTFHSDILFVNVLDLQQFGNLKYIRIPYFVSGLEKIVEKFRNLQTLEVCELYPVYGAQKFNISKLHKLRNLCIGPAFPEYLGCTLREGISNLKELQTLSAIDIGQSDPKVVEELAELHQLKRLELRNMSKAQFKSFSASLGELSCLRHLKLQINPFLDEAAGGFLDTSSPPKHLRNITVKGRMGKLPTWLPLVNLKKIILFYTQLDEDAMTVLQRLHTLTFLSLCVNAYTGAKLIFANNAFLKLRELYVREIRIEEVVFEEHPLPELEILNIVSCNLKSGINGIEYLPRIKKLVLRCVTVLDLAVVEKTIKEHPNHPELVCD